MTKKIKLFLFLVLFMCVNLNVSAKTVKLKNYTSGRTLKQAFNAAFNNMSNGDVLEVASGTYNMKELIYVSKKVTIKGVGNKPIFIKANSATGVDLRYCFVANSNGIKFVNLIIDGGNIIKHSLINTNNKKNIQVKNCVLRNTAPPLGLYFGSSGISSQVFKGGSWKEGTATSGLKVSKTVFNNIRNTCIYIINRNTDVAGGNVTKLDPIVIDSCLFKNYRRAITADCGNDYAIPECKSSKRRYITNINATIRGNTFEKAEAWHIDLVQASNAFIIGNTMKGPKETSISPVVPMSCIHIEELSNNITIKDNALTSSIQPCKLIDIETTKKWRTCDTEYEKTDVNRYVPEWVPKNVKIANNTFTGIAHDAISGNDMRNITIIKNKFGGFNGKFIAYFKKGKEGACNITMPTSGSKKNLGINTNKVKIEWKAGCGDTTPFSVSQNLNEEGVLEFIPEFKLNINDTSYSLKKEFKSIHVYSIDGIKVLEVLNSNRDINLQNLNSGIYIFKILSSDGTTEVKKIFIN